MRGLILLAIVSVVALVWGGQNTYIGLRDRSQRVITCADYLKTSPDDRWLKLTDCEYDFDHLAYEQYKSGDIRAVYLPLRPKGVEGGPTRIVVKRDDKEMIKVVNALEHDEAKPQPAFDHVIAQLDQPAEGLVQFGLDLDDKDKKDLAGLGLGLDKDFVIIENGSKPKLLYGLLALLFGVGMIGLFVWRLVRRFRAPKAPPPGPRMPVGPQGPTNPVSAFERPI